MTSIDVIENKISAVRKYLSILDRYERFARPEIENDIDIRGAVERYLYLVTQSTIDLAESIIAYKRLRKPTTMAESFHRPHNQLFVMHPMNPLFTTHSPADAESFETQSAQRKTNMMVTRILRMMNSAHTPAPSARERFIFRHRSSGAWNVGPMHLSPHRVNTMDPLCDLCACPP